MIKSLFAKEGVTEQAGEYVPLQKMHQNGEYRGPEMTCVIYIFLGSYMESEVSICMIFSGWSGRCGCF